MNEFWTWPDQDGPHQKRLMSPGLRSGHVCTKWAKLIEENVNYVEFLKLFKIIMCKFKQPYSPMIGIIVGPLWSDLEEAKLFLFFLFLFLLAPLGPTEKTVQLFTSDASQTHIKYRFRKLTTRTIQWRPRDDNDKDTRKDKDKDKDRTFKKKVFLYI